MFSQIPYFEKHLSAAFHRVASMRQSGMPARENIFRLSRN
jgi:hypothetical protein